MRTAKIHIAEETRRCRVCKLLVNKGDRYAPGMGGYFHMGCMVIYKEQVGIIKSDRGIESMKTMEGEVIPAGSNGNGHNGNGNGNGAGKVLADMIAPYILDIGKMEEKLAAKIDSMVKGAVENLPLKIEIKDLNGKVSLIKCAHFLLKTLLYLVQKRHHIYLWGDAGSGKSTAAAQVAEALKLTFGYISLNPQTPESRLIGYLDANGQYRETLFAKIYKTGGVFCIDEMDNASPALLTTLNSLLENGHGAFPDGMHGRHKDFVLICTGNTNGKGANAAYADRRKFDDAFSERFTFLKWTYDEKMERAAALAVNPKAEKWIDFIQDMRKFCSSKYPRVLVSPRASIKGASYLLEDILSWQEIAEMIIFKGLDETISRDILNNVKYEGGK